MPNDISLVVFSDAHYACEAEKRRGQVEYAAIDNPFLRACVWMFRYFIWLRHPYEHNHLLAKFIDMAGDADIVVGLGDYSCDSAFIGASDDAAFNSINHCISKVRERYGARFFPVIGDHDLGKKSIFGGKGATLVQSLRRLEDEIRAPAFWTHEVGRYLLVGVTSTLVGLPVFARECLESELPEWEELRKKHINQIREAFNHPDPGKRILLFLHDPTALPFLWDDEQIRSQLGRVELTFIGHLHSRMVFWESKILAGIPAIGFLGNAIRRMTTALNRARRWYDFNTELCPSLAGIQMLKDGAFYRVTLDPHGDKPPHSELIRIGWK
ncbi:MAG: hypothetical protein K9N48_06060 [Verrucomicrobia bacterium]|nr:hypothetical protein [Verrucomicrobiota bacterium]MCF7707953.1 hypothetical protein [Verrucomicrobiota bacterium]